MTFKELQLATPLLEAIEQEGYTNPTPIQEQSIPILLEGKDLLACAQTGTGKTAAFALPILHQLYSNRQEGGKKHKLRVLVVTPTRELAIQIAESFSAYGKNTGLRNTVVFGGVKQGGQTNALRKGVDIIVATPGRLLDLMDQGYISLKSIEYFVLDEADRMLDMGFIHDIKRIISKLPHDRQSLFFSATMPPSIISLSHKILGNPEKVTVSPEQTTAEKVMQSVYFVSKKNKAALLNHLLDKEHAESVLVFSRTKYGADKIVKSLAKGGYHGAAIHGNKSQNARQRALGNFKDGKIKVLVATDIAARGIDVDNLSLVINFDLPNIPETYVHRIGRTGRAKASGKAISFCNLEERPYLNDIQKLIGKKIFVIKDHPFHDESETPLKQTIAKPKQGQKRHFKKGSWNKKNNRNKNSRSFSGKRK